METFVLVSAAAVAAILTIILIAAIILAFYYLKYRREGKKINKKIEESGIDLKDFPKGEELIFKDE